MRASLSRLTCILFRSIVISIKHIVQLVGLYLLFSGGKSLIELSTNPAGGNYGIRGLGLAILALSNLIPESLSLSNLFS